MELIFRKAKMSDMDLIENFQHGIGVCERRLDKNVKRQGRISYYSRKDMKDAISSKDSIVLICELNKRPIGLGLATIRKNHGDWNRFKKQGNISLLFVKKEHRKKGIGKLLLQHLIEWLKKRNIQDIRLQVCYNNINAIETYRKAGFKDNLLIMSYRPD